mmetsp:Transcript_5557/g.16483  ORF Transcript_5557/g.16483 Transcript_5557/m.16483 type:complete len:187 (-) Transcript_5557:369-929(-)
MTSYMPANALFEFPDGEVIGSSDQPGNVRMKQGHICCGGCCDVRRAVIIVDIIMIIFLTFITITILLGYELVELAAREDDASEDTIETANQLKHAHIGWIILYHLLQIVGYAFAIQGAVKFNRKLVLAGFVVYCASFTMNLLVFDLVGMLLTGFFAYPHFYLAKEIEENVMTPENYANELHSCCCT